MRRGGEGGRTIDEAVGISEPVSAGRGVGQSAIAEVEAATTPATDVEVAATEPLLVAVMVVVGPVVAAANTDAGDAVGDAGGELTVTVNCKSRSPS